MRRPRPLAPVVVAALLAMLSAGCSGAAEQGEPGFPPVDDARDARVVDPCSLPTTEQLATLGISSPGVASTAPEGPRCEWRSDAELAITLYTEDGGLATLAENSEPTTARVRLAGYPALETFTGVGEFCQYDVGVAPDQVVMASLTGGRPDSCTALQAVLPAMVAELPAVGA